MNRTSPRDPSSRSSSRRRSKTTSTNTRKTGSGRPKKGSAWKITLVLDLLLVALIGILGFRLVKTHRTLEDQTAQIQKLQTQLLSARTSKPASEERRPSAAPASPPSETQTYTSRQQAVLKGIVDAPDIGQLIPQKPSLGGQWRCFSEDQVFFLDQNHVAFTYEDGHKRGIAIVEVRTPQQRST